MTTNYELDVRYAEGDLGSVVHHSVYAIWYEAARMDFFEKLGLGYEEQLRRNILPPLVDLHVVYRAPVRYPGRVRIETRIASYGPKKIELAYRLYYNGVLANEATTLIIWTDIRTMKSMDLSAEHPDIYAKIAEAAED